MSLRVRQGRGGRGAPVLPKVAVPKVAVPKVATPVKHKMVKAVAEKPRKFCKVVVDITAIKNQASLDAKSIDGFKRAGYDIGLKQAKTKGLTGTCTLSKEFAKRGYELATEYLRSKGY